MNNIQKAAFCSFVAVMTITMITSNQLSTYASPTILVATALLFATVFVVPSSIGIASANPNINGSTRPMNTLKWQDNVIKQPVSHD